MSTLIDRAILTARADAAAPSPERMAAAAEARSQAIDADKRDAWQPIASAPKDGTWQVVSHFDQACFYWWRRARFVRSEWRTGSGVVMPSYWMPLPATPLGSNAPQAAPGAPDTWTTGAVRAALERITHSYRLLLAGKPVSDAAETLAEADAALSAQQEGKK